MADFITLSKKIKDSSAVMPRRKLTGRNALAGRIAGFLTERSGLSSGFIILCTEDGLICSYTAPGHEEDLTGFTMTGELMAELRIEGAEMITDVGGFTLLSSIPAEQTSDRQDQVRSGGADGDLRRGSDKRKVPAGQL